MIGQRGGSQERLFYSLNLDDHVPSDHLLRGIDRFFDLGDLRQHLAPYYSKTGRPSIDPGLMVRMLIIGYCFGIRSDASSMRRGSRESGLSLVLPSRSRRPHSGPFDILQESARPLP